MSRILLPGALAALAALSTGCPSLSHRIPHDQLMVLSQTPPEVRGERVRVLQSLGDRDEPPEPGERVSGGVHVVVFAPIWVGGTPRRHGHRPPAVSHGGGGGGGGGGAPAGIASSKKDAGKAVLVLAAVAALAGVLTEGVRYDGYVRLHPMHPVHLWGPTGYTWMPLAHITPDVAAWAETAVVRDEEGPWTPIERRPLDRQGFTYSLLMGAGEVALIGADPQPGFASHILLGYYPTHMVGIQGDIAYAWAEDDLGNTIFDGRYSLELDVLPLSAGIFHAGGYGALGLAYRSDDGIQHDDQDTLFGAGGLMQLELTTRLALTLRLGQTFVHDERLSELTGGISID